MADKEQPRAEKALDTCLDGCQQKLNDWLHTVGAATKSTDGTWVIPDRDESMRLHGLCCDVCRDAAQLAAAEQLAHDRAMARQKAGV
jgi:hypothetical protein